MTNTVEIEPQNDEQTLKDLDRTHADGDQTATANGNQRGSDRNDAAAAADRRGSDSDQRAFDRDQGVADKGYDTNIAPPTEELSYDRSRAERKASSVVRDESSAERRTERLGRARQANVGDGSPSQGDQTSATRDRNAKARDCPTVSEGHAVTGGDDLGPATASLMRVYNGFIARASHDRARAARDRERAALDRTQPVVDPRQARVELRRARLDRHAERASRKAAALAASSHDRADALTPVIPAA